MVSLQCSCRDADKTAVGGIQWFVKGEIRRHQQLGESSFTDDLNKRTKNMQSVPEKNIFQAAAEIGQQESVSRAIQPQFRF